jgi:2-amino-4-hydroxy-6-hydroxymethyldihydropteridine diphosphokinase
MPTAYIGVGSNILPEENIQRALSYLSRYERITGVSTFYLTTPFDRPGDPPFYNGVVRISTLAGPRDLKYHVLRNIEKRLHRRRTDDKSAPRTIDLDLLVYEDMVVNDDELQIPDPGILERPFVAKPLCELAGDLILPGWGTPVRDIAERLKDQGMRPMHEYTQQLRRIIHNGLRKSGAPGKGAAD